MWDAFIIGNMKTNAVIIAGPTASGKSDFAHRLAMATGGVIINCDSVQIYRGIENISASPMAGREVAPNIDGVPYRLFSILDLGQQISVADYLGLARGEYDAAVAAGRPAIFVGGTGFYIDAICRGLAQMPEITPDVRRRARDMVATDPKRVTEMLGENAPLDSQRRARALEVLLQTGHPMAYWWDRPRVGAIVPTPVRVLLNPPRDVLLKRIAARIPEMISGGAMAEAQRIIKNGWNENRAIGATQLCRYLRGEIDRDAVIENWTVRTNQYAKRQRTWFKTQYVPDVTIDSTDGAAFARVMELIA